MGEYKRNPQDFLFSETLCKQSPQGTNSNRRSFPCHKSLNKSCGGIYSMGASDVARLGVHLFSKNNSFTGEHFLRGKTFS